MIKGGANAFLQMANTTREQFNKVGGHYKMHTLYKASNKTQANSMNNGAALALAVVTRGKGRGEAGPEVLPNEHQWLGVGKICQRTSQRAVGSP